MLGRTYAMTLDAALDEISRLTHEHDNALAAISDYIRRNPDAETDHDLTLARMALL